jgi:protein O-mannosyl-transferase
MKPKQTADRKADQPGDKVVAGNAARGPGVWLLLPALLLATLLAYYPAWQGGMLWDDDAHITRADLRPASGLWHIWFDLGATQQYYPLVHSAFWLQYRLWGGGTLGYHLISIILHALSAFLVALVLRRLAVPGALLAAVIFALHPVHVESVAWITELKNTLSGVLYLSSALAYLRFDERREKRFYSLATILFVLALLSKTVTATLPAALLVVFWWRRGRLHWRRDALPLAPWFALGAAAGLLTAWVERTLIGAEGAAFQFTLVERCLIAGRVVWFYLGKIFWPADLVFIYPRWQVSQSTWWQYLYPLCLLTLMAGLWLLRKRSRAPLAAMLIFCGTLFPALGFVNVFPFIFSFVADHFQYLASLAIIASCAAFLAHLCKRRHMRTTAAVAGTLVLGGVLAGLTWRQSTQYVNAETLYRATIRRNPSCWMAHNNLGASMLHGDAAELQAAAAHIQEALRLRPIYPGARNNLGLAMEGLGRLEEAVAQFREALRLKPDFAEAHINLGTALERLGRTEEAAEEYRASMKNSPGSAAARVNLSDVLQESGRLEEAAALINETLRLNPGYAEAHNSLGNVLQRMRRFEEAAAQYREALRLKPDYAEACTNLGMALQRMGRPEEAATQHREALRLKPDYALARYNLGSALQAAGHFEEAATAFQEALRLDSADAAAHVGLGSALEALGRLDEAVTQYNEALKLKPDSAEAHNKLGYALLRSGRPGEAVNCFEEALRLKPDYAVAHFNLGNVLQAAGRLQEAVIHYREALGSEPDSAELHNNLGVALESLNRHEEAATHFKEAVRLKPDYKEARDNLTRATATRRK